LEFGIGAGVRKTGMMWLPDGRKSFKVGLAVQTQQYRRVTDRQTDRHLSMAKTALAERRAGKNETSSEATPRERH